MFRQEILFVPGFDYRKDPEKSQYGCHGLEIHFLLHGEKATVESSIFTPWLPSGFQEFGLYKSSLDMQPMEACVYAHIYNKDGRTCDFSPTGNCTCESYTTQKHLKLLLTKGQQAVFQSLEKYYNKIVFEEYQQL